MILRRINTRSGIRCFYKSAVCYNDIKVSADDLSNALKNRLKINQKDLNDAIDNDDLEVPKYVSTKYAEDLDKTIPESARYYIVKEKLKTSGSSPSNRFLVPDSDKLEQVAPIDKTQLPKLAHDLEKVLKKKGVHYFYLKRSKQFQFDQGLNKIDRLKEFEHNLLSNFVSPSKDKSLLELAKSQKKTYYSSTSSMTSSLFQFYLLLNDFKEDKERFPFGDFTKLVKKLPSSFIVNKQDPQQDIYSIESDKSADLSHYLAEFGHIAEIILTNETEDIKLFKKLEREYQAYKVINNDDSVNALDLQKLVSSEISDTDVENFEKFKNPENVYNIASFDKFLMRSQLDCHHEDLPGNGTFDLKSRAIGDIRYDKGNINMKETTYSNQFSYDQEFQDLVKTGALLKYAFQARIGQMDGIFVAFHNFNQFFAFQYLKLEDIDKIFFNNSSMASYIADSQFKFSLQIWSHLLDIIRHDLKGFNLDSFRVVLKSEFKPNTQFRHLKVNVVPLTKDQVVELQNYPSSITLSDDLEERQRLLKAHKDKLDEINESTAANVLSYTVETCDWVGGKKLDYHKLPTSKDARWRLQFRIMRQKPDPSSYLKHLTAMTKVITSESPKRKTDNRKNSKFEKFSKPKETVPKRKTSNFKPNSKPPSSKNKTHSQRDLALLDIINKSRKTFETKN